MSFSSEYYRLLKKKKEEQQQNNTAVGQGVTTGTAVDSFTEEYDRLLQQKLQEQQNDLDSAFEIGPVGSPFGSVDERYRRAVELYGAPTHTVDGEELTLFEKILATNGATNIKRKEPEEKEESWGQAGLLDDGYHFGDIIGSTIITAADVATGILQGASSLVEGVTDLGMYGVSGVADLFGADDFAEGVKKEAQKNYVGDAFNSFREGVGFDENSFLGGKSYGVAQGLGQVGGIILTGGAAGAAGLGAAGTTAVTTGVMGVSSMGSGMSEAYQGGASDEEALNYGVIKGIVDAGTELIFGGLGKTVKAVGVSKGISSLDDVFAKKLSSKISGQFAKNAIEYGVKASAEGVEEVLAGIGAAVGKKLTYMPEEDLGKLIENEDLLDQFVMGAVTSGIAQSGDLIKTTKGKQDFITGLSANEQSVVDKVYESEIAKAEKESGKKLTNKEKNNIYDRVMDDLQKGRVSTGAIEEILGGDSYKAYKDAVDKDNATIKELQGLYEGEELEQKIKDILDNSGRNELKKKLSEEVFGLAQEEGSKMKDRGSFLAESYYELSRGSQKFEADLSQYDEKYRNTVQKAIDSGILNNKRSTHEMVDLFAKLSADKGVEIDFTDNEKIKGTSFAVEGKTVNGYVDKDGNITVNIESPKYLNSIVGHEITHVLEGSKDLYEALQKEITAYAESKGEYKDRLRTAISLYENVDGYKGAEGHEKIKREVVADLVGDYLFTDADFVRNLHTNNRNLFQKIYDEIKYLCKIATAGSKEARQLESVKRAFEKAYQDGSTAKGEVKHSLSDSPIPTKDDISKKKPMRVVDISTPQTKGTFAERRKQIRANAKDVISKPYLNGDTNTLIFLTNESYTHAFNNLGDVQLNAAEHLPELIENAVLTHAEKPTHGSEYANGVYTFFAAGKTANGIRPVKLKVKEYVYSGQDLPKNIKEYFENSPQGYAASYDTVVLAVEEIEENPSGSVKDLTQKEPFLDPDGFLTYKVADLLDLVKGDAEKYLPKFSLSSDQEAYFKDSVVRDEAGNLKVMYHGTSQGGHTVFDTYGSNYGLFGTGSYFTDNKEIAESYTKKGKGKNPQVYESYLNITNPMDMDAQANPEEWRNAFDEVDFPESGTNEQFYRVVEEFYADQMMPKWEVAEIIQSSIQSGMGYDGITHIGGGRVNADGVKHRVYIAFEPEQIKRTDNLKPTSDPDIRFSLSEPVEESKNLVALHNLTQDKLLKSLELGGLPMPSIAITKASIPHDNFGEITMIFGKDTVDPKANKKNVVYSADAWTPTFPQVEYEADVDAERRINAKLADLGQKVDDFFKNDLDRLKYAHEDNLNRHGGEEGLIQRAMENYGLKAAYLEEIGQHIEKVTKQEEIPKGYNSVNEAKYESLMAILDVTSAEEIGKLNLKETKEQYGNQLEAIYPGMTKTAIRMSGVFNQIQNYIEKRNSEPEYRTVTDAGLTRNAVDEAIDMEGFETWTRNLFSGIVKDSGIYNNKDLFTPSGNRRSFKQTHLPFTLENIVKAMASQNDGNTKNVSGFNGIKSLRAGTAERFKSIEAMHEMEGRLQHLTQEEADKLNDDLSSRLYAIIETIDKEGGYKGESNSFIRFDTIGEILMEVSESGKYNVADIQRVFSQYSRNISDDTAADIKQLLYDVTQMPVNIYEAKPERAVSFDEAGVFVIPNNANIKLKQELLNRGYSIAEYDPNVEGDRQRVVNQFEEYKFSLSDVGETPKKYGNFNIRGEDVRYNPPVSESADDIGPISGDVAPTNEANADIGPLSTYDVPASAPVSEAEASAYQRERLESLSDVDAPFEQDADHYDLHETGRMPKTKVVEIAKRLRETLGLSNRQMSVARGLIEEYSKNETLSRDELFGIIKERFGTQTFTHQSDVNEVQAFLRQSTISVTEDIKNNIADYDSVRKKLSRKIKFSNDGVPVDTKYQELAEMFPAYFPDDIVHPADQLEQIAEVASMEKTFDEDVDLDDKTLTEAADIIVNEITDYRQKWTQRLAERNAKHFPTDKDVPIAESEYNARVESLYESLKDKPSGRYHKVDGYGFIVTRDTSGEGATITIRNRKGETVKERIEGGRYLTNNALWQKAAESVAKKEFPNVVSDAYFGDGDIGPVGAKQQEDRLSRSIKRIDKMFEYDKAELDQEFQIRRDDLQAEFGDKDSFVARRAMELYAEISRLKKGVRASKPLGHLLGYGYPWQNVKMALLNVNNSPVESVDRNSEMESIVREALDEEYKNGVYKLDELEGEYQSRLKALEDKAETKRKNAKTANQRRTKQDELSARMEGVVGDTSTWVDKKLGLSYKTNTLRRNLRDVVRDANGNRDFAKADAIYEMLQGKYNLNEASLNRESNRIKKVFADMKITDAESTYIQMLGEFRHNPETTLSEERVKEFLEKNKGSINEAKVDKAIELARETYDSLLLRVNEVLREQGMKEIPYRKGYFPHFTEEKQGFLAKLFNWKTQNNDIPTDIAGITEQFNPNRSWQSFNKQRKGDTTDYNFLKGMDSYVFGALDWIYHIEDIQNRRALENYIRYTHSEEGVKAKIDAIRANEEYDADEMQEQIDLVYREAGNPLNNFVTDLRAGTNKLANKKSSLDRGMEEMVNRKVYSTMTNLSNRVSANMVGGSISSALTNFIPITQSWGEVSPISSLRAMLDTIKSSVHDDGMVGKSAFLTNRLNSSENLYKTTWDKIGDKIGWLMEGIDSFTAQTVWRSKYLENVSNGMSESQAIANADQFAENVIAGRSRGNRPTIFDSKNPLVKTLTAFQLEVNNQYGYMFKDMPQDVKNKSVGRLVKGYATMFLGAYAYNALFSSLTGRDAAFDPVGIIEDLLRDLGLFGEDDEEEPTDTLMGLAENIVQEIPFVGGLVGGGRVPISSALPYDGDVMGMLEDVGKAVDSGDYQSLTKEWLKPLYYLAMPMGGGQLKKSIEGLSMFDESLPIAGSYTDSGDLRFPVEDTLGNRIQAGLFGQWANGNAREYFEGGHKPLDGKQIQEFIDIDAPIADYWKYREGLSGLKTLAEKADYINGLDLSDGQKNILINNIADREEEIDMSDYNNYGSFEEFDFATKDPEMYGFLKENNVSYEAYKNADEDTKGAYRWALKNPEKHTVAKVIAGDVVRYRSLTSDLYDIKADKDASGKSISGSRKEKVIDYINGLDLDYGEKIILFKSQYTSDDTYNADILDYLNSRDDISYEETAAILTELGFTVYPDGTVQW